MYVGKIRVKNCQQIFLPNVIENKHAVVNYQIIFISGRAGADANVPRVSFSAALTNPMVTSGTITFDKIFVNEGNFYNPRTGKLDIKIKRVVIHCAM